MTDIQTQLIEVSQLRVGMFIYLDIGWMAHPFPVNSFEIRSEAQIATIRSLGLDRVRYAPGKSTQETPSAEVIASNVVPIVPEQKAKAEKSRRELLAEQNASLMLCEKQFGQASKSFRDITEQVHSQPENAKAESVQLITGLLNEILGEDEATIRLLSENSGEKTSLHSVNVTLISLLLGKAMHLSKPDMLELGVGALLHDIGKLELPDRMRWQDDAFSHAERQLYQSHVAQGVMLARKMALSPMATLLVAQHHEHADGSGYPSGISEDKLSPLARIVALVNRYDNLCNPGNPSTAITPHEALSLLFAQNKSQFHIPTITAFIRMMGIYPPGSVVQLNDDRYAIVVSVNSTRPIKPKVIIYDHAIARDEALIVNLEIEKHLGIRRSLKPLQLPKAAYDYLSPRRRLCYFFERGGDTKSAPVTL